MISVTDPNTRSTEKGVIVSRNHFQKVSSTDKSYYKAYREIKLCK